MRKETVGYLCHIGYVLHKSVPAVLSHSSLSLSCVWLIKARLWSWLRVCVCVFCAVHASRVCKWWVPIPGCIAPPCILRFCTVRKWFRDLLTDINQAAAFKNRIADFQVWKLINAPKPKRVFPEMQYFFCVFFLFCFPRAVSPLSTICFNYFQLWEIEWFLSPFFFPFSFVLCISEQ